MVEAMGGALSGSMTRLSEAGATIADTTVKAGTLVADGTVKATTAVAETVAEVPVILGISPSSRPTTEEGLADIIAPTRDALGQRIVQPAKIDIAVAEKALAAATAAGVAAPVLAKAKAAILAAKEAQKPPEEVLADAIAPNRDVQGQRVVRPAELDIADCEKALAAAVQAGVAGPVLQKAEAAIAAAKAEQQTAEALADAIAPNRNAQGLRVVRPAEIDIPKAEKALAQAAAAGVSGHVLQKAKSAILVAKAA